MGAVGFVPDPRRLRRELRFQPRRSCRQRILPSLGVGTGCGQRDRGGIPGRPAHDASLAAIHRAVRGPARSAGRSGIMGIFSARGGKSSRAIGSPVRKLHLRCSSDGSAAVSESHGPGPHRALAIAEPRVSPTSPLLIQFIYTLVNWFFSWRNPLPAIRAIFWDVGGVLLTNAWGRTERAKAFEKF